jgi:hypothetical protein
MTNWKWAAGGDEAREEACARLDAGRLQLGPLRFAEAKNLAAYIS